VQPPEVLPLDKLRIYTINQSDRLSIEQVFFEKARDFCNAPFTKRLM
jgi:hypothetical protein